MSCRGVVACEGSMFKSKFANALSTLMAGALGVAGAEQKLAIAYGGEAGAMDPALADLVRDTCQDAAVMARNAASVDVLGKLGIGADLGTDTAWTFEPAPASIGEAHLRAAGWDGETPILAVCPINAFWWPVKPDVRKGLERMALGLHKQQHYRSVYFHAGGPEIAAKQDAYLEGLAQAIRATAAARPVFPVLIAMEALDERACEALRDKLTPDLVAPPIFGADGHDMYTLVSVLRRASALVSSRYHALVTSMPGLVPSAGVTMDERIRNLMIDRGTPELSLEVDDPALGPQLAGLIARLFDEGPDLAHGIGRTVVRNLGVMGQMGQWLVEVVRERHPDFPIRAELGADGDRWAHLPPLPPSIEALIEEHRA